MPLDFGTIHNEFLADDTGQIDFEGARYSGKTWACCAKVIAYVQKYPGMEFLICRYANEETEKKLKPEFLRVCHLIGEYPEWQAKEAMFLFGNGSKVYAYGLRSQDKLGHLSKVRGLGVGGIWNDQSEELPEDIGAELPFGTRQPGYPHPLIFSPNPPPEDHWLSDMFPDDNSVPGRRYYRVALQDNPHCPEDKLAELERLYSPTHAKYKSLVLGLRGPNVSGKTIYEDTFDLELHAGPLARDPSTSLLEAFHIGEHHPVWMAAQRNQFGGLEILGGIMGKRMYLEDFLPIVERHRGDWFGESAKTMTCCDPPPSQGQDLRFTNIELLKETGLQPRWRDNANTPDVREAIIQHIAGMMRRRLGKTQAFYINNDPAHWLMASSVIIKQSKFFIDGCQSNYVWDENAVSVGSKKYRQPKIDNEWVNGAQRCLENIILNFCAMRETDEQAERRRREASTQNMLNRDTLNQGKYGWMA